MVWFWRVERGVVGVVWWFWFNGICFVLWVCFKLCLADWFGVVAFVVCGLDGLGLVGLLRFSCCGCLLCGDCWLGLVVLVLVLVDCVRRRVVGGWWFAVGFVGGFKFVVDVGW